MRSKQAEELGQFVWLPEEGQVRVNFRREFTLETEADTAVLNLFADANYLLYVNGNFVAEGPLRFYPEYPHYDTHDLRTRLRPGKNVIAVAAVYPSGASFHHVASRPGFWASGLIATGGELISLETPGAWKALPVEAYDSTAPRLSFALPPVEVRFAEKLPRGWNAVEAPDLPWRRLEIVADAPWGELRPRALPALETRTLAPKRLLRQWTGAAQNWLAWRLADEKARHLTRNKPSDGKPAAAGFTWIYSPRKQEVQGASWWGEYYLNGASVADGDEPAAGQVGVLTRKFSFEKGWNFLGVTCGIILGNWDFTLAFPAEAGLQFSSSKDGGPGVAKLQPRFVDEQSEELAALTAAFSEGREPETRDWTIVEEHPFLPIPARKLAWQIVASEERAEGPVQEMRIAPGADGVVQLDFGETVLGRIRIEYSAPAGTTIDAGWSEDLENGRVSYFQMVLMPPADRQVAGGGREVMESYYPRGFRYLEIGVSGHTEEVIIHSVRLEERAYPHELAGHFRCDDANLTLAWALGWPSLRVCSEDVFTDTPWRERTLYGGDLLVAFGVAVVLSGDVALTRRSVDVFIESKNENTQWLQSMAPMERDRSPLFEYPLWTLMAGVRTLDYAWDNAYAQHLYEAFLPLIKKGLSDRHETGLLRAASKPFLDHVAIVKDLPVSTGVNAVFIVVLCAFARLALRLGRVEEARRWKNEAETLGPLLHKHCWSETLGAYCDGLHEDGAQCENTHPVSTIYPLYAEVPPPEAAPAAFEHIRNAWGNELPIADKWGSPYSIFYLLGGLYRYGLAENAEWVMRRVYGPMLAGGATSTWEAFSTRKSLSHVWSAAATFYLQTEVLGVRYDFQHGYDPDDICIAPAAASISSAEGKVPHPRGKISVSWAIEGGTLRLGYRAPAGVRVTVAPRGRLARLSLESRGLSHAGKATRI